MAVLKRQTSQSRDTSTGSAVLGIAVGGGLVIALVVWALSAGFLIVPQLLFGMLSLLLATESVPPTTPLNRRQKLGQRLTGASLLGSIAFFTLMWFWPVLPYVESMFVLLGTWAAGQIVHMTSWIKSSWFALMSLLTAVALMVGVVYLPSPEALEDPEEPKNKTTIVVSCVDSNGNPVGDANVYFDLEWTFLESDKHFSDKEEDHDGMAKTGSLTVDELSVPGVATWRFKSDPRYKRLVVHAVCDYREGQEGIQATFSMARLEIPVVPRGSVIPVRLVLPEQPRSTTIWFDFRLRNAGEHDLVLVNEGAELSSWITQEQLAYTFEPQRVPRDPSRLVRRVETAGYPKNCHIYLARAESDAGTIMGWRLTRIEDVTVEPGERLFREIDFAR